MPLIRGLDQLLADLDRRARPGARSRNTVIPKFTALQDMVAFSSDTVTSTVFAVGTTPYKWAAASSTDLDIIWSSFQWK